MRYRGQLDAEQRYEPGDIVQDRGGGYRVRSYSGNWCPVAAPADPSCGPGRDGRDGAPGADGTDGKPGAPGAPGEGFRFKGVWKRGVYQQGDVATSGGSSWVCVAETNTRPGVTKAWAIMAKAGADGAAGAAGRDGTNTSVIRFRRTIEAGPKLQMILAEDAPIGAAVFTRSDGLAGLAQANAEPNALAIGLVTEAQPAGRPAEIATSGLVGGLSGLVPGSIYYLSPNVPGGITATYPTGVGGYVVIMGAAVSETELNLAIHWANYIGA